MTTLDRDIRLRPIQIEYLDRLARKRISELDGKIERAKAARQVGARIQHGTLERHIDEQQALAEVRVALAVAREQIQHQFRAKLGLDLASP